MMKQSTSFAQVANNLLTVLQGYSKTIRLLLVMFVALTVSAEVWADYTIAFKSTTGADGSTAQTTIANLISSGGTNVSTISATRAYNGKSGYGIKLGSSSSTGNVIMTLANSAQIKASKLVVKAAYYDSNKTLKVTVTYTDNTTTTQTITPASSLTDYDVSLTDTKTIKQIKIESVTASKGRMYCHSIKVVAASAAVTTYTVTYDLNGGTGTTPTQANVAAGGTFTLAASSGFSKAGYSFAGWNDGTTTYNAGATYTMPAKAVTLKAQWTALPKYTVTLNAGSGTCDDESLTETSGGAGVTLPTANPPAACATDGWKFAGWWTGSVAETTTSPGELLTADSNYKPTTNCTLYAVYSHTEAGGGGSGFYLSVTKDATTYYIGEKGSGSFLSAVTDVNSAATFNIENNQYLYYGNKTYVSSTANSTSLTIATTTPSATWTITDEGETITFKSNGTGGRYLAFNYNNGSPRFSSYGSTYTYELTKHTTSTTIYNSNPDCGSNKPTVCLIHENRYFYSLFF